MLLSVTNLSFQDDKQRLTQLADFTLLQGQHCLVYGNSGSGKSHLFSILLGLANHLTGKVLFDNQSLVNNNKKRIWLLRRQIGVIFDQPALLANLNIAENLLLCANSFYPELSNKQIKQKVNSIAHDFGLANLLSLRPAQISLGEQKTVALARALLHQPKILFWDAALQGLDEVLSAISLQILADLAKQNTTLMLFTSQAHKFENLAHLSINLNTQEVNHAPF